MGALLVGFFIYGPKAIGGGVDETFAVLLALGGVFAWLTRKRVAPTFVFDGNAVADPPRPPVPVPACRQRRRGLSRRAYPTASPWRR